MNPLTDIPEPIDPVAMAAEIERKLRRADEAHKIHQFPQPTQSVDHAAALGKAGFPLRATLTLEEMHGPGLSWAKALLPKALADGLIVLVGPTGRGKTVISTWLAMERAKRNKGIGQFLTIFALYARVQQCWTKKEDSEPVLRAWKKAPFLVLDEVQTRSENVWSDGVLDELVNARYSAMLPTVLIANLELATAQQYLGPRIMDRANECGGIVDCNWATYRI